MTTHISAGHAQDPDETCSASIRRSTLNAPFCSTVARPWPRAARRMSGRGSVPAPASCPSRVIDRLCSRKKRAPGFPGLSLCIWLKRNRMSAAAAHLCYALRWLWMGILQHSLGEHARITPCFRIHSNASNSQDPKLSAHVPCSRGGRGESCLHCPFLHPAPLTKRFPKVVLYEPCSVVM